MRAAVRAAAPEALERISYGLPHDRFPGESGVRSRLGYFGIGPGGVAFYTRPRFLEGHHEEVAPFLMASSTLRLPWDRPLPLALVRRLVRDAVRTHALSGR